MSHQRLQGGKALVRIHTYYGSSEKPSEPDYQGNYPIIIDPLAGSIPSKRVLNGTIASQIGFTQDTVHVVKWQEVDPDPDYGRQFEIKKLFDISNDTDRIEKWEERLGNYKVVSVHDEADSEHTSTFESSRKAQSNMPVA